MKYFVTRINVAASMPSDYGIDLSDTDWTPEAYMTFGRLLESRKRSALIKVEMAKAQGNMKSSQSSYYGYGHFDDCGDSYEKEYQQSRAYLEGLKGSGLDNDNFLPLFKYFHAVHTPYFKQMRKQLENQNKAFRALVDDQKAFIDHSCKFINAFCSSHQAGTLRYEMKVTKETVGDSILELGDISWSSPDGVKYDSIANREELVPHIVAVAKLALEDTLNPELLASIHTGADNTMSIESATKRVSKIKQRAANVLNTYEKIKAS